MILLKNLIEKNSFTRGDREWLNRFLTSEYNRMLTGKIKWSKDDRDLIADYIGEPRLDIDDRYILKFGKYEHRDFRTLDISYLVYLVGPNGRERLNVEQLKLVKETLCQKTKKSPYALQLVGA